MKKSSEDLQSVLIGVIAYSSENISLLIATVKEIKNSMSILDSSSVYSVRGKKKRPAHIHDLRTIITFDGLSVAIHCVTELKPEAIMKELLKIEESVGYSRLHRNLSLNLLMVEEEIRVSPTLSLPHPDLHRRHELLIPAAEIWGEKKHPVLKKDIQTLVSELPNKPWGEFFAQKSTLLNNIP